MSTRIYTSNHSIYERCRPTFSPSLSLKTNVRQLLKITPPDLNSIEFNSRCATWLDGHHWLWYHVEFWYFTTSYRCGGNCLAHIGSWRTHKSCLTLRAKRIYQYGNITCTPINIYMMHHSNYSICETILLFILLSFSTSESTPNIRTLIFQRGC